jgi:hypothetical protein
LSDPDDRDPWAPPDEGGDDDRGQQSPTGSAPPTHGGPNASGPGPRTPFGTPTGPGPTRPHGRGLLLLAGGALVAAFAMPLLGWGLCAAVIVLAVRARRRAAAEGTTAPGTQAALVLAVGGLVVPMLLLGLFYDEITTYADCRQAANTHQAQDDCDARLEDMLGRYVGG